MSKKLNLSHIEQLINIPVLRHVWDCGNMPHCLAHSGWQPAPSCRLLLGDTCLHCCWHETVRLESQYYTIFACFEPTFLSFLGSCGYLRVPHWVPKCNWRLLTVLCGPRNQFLSGPPVPESMYKINILRFNNVIVQ